jgi:hypothetical protein
MATPTRPAAGAGVNGSTSAKSKSRAQMVSPSVAGVEADEKSARTLLMLQRSDPCITSVLDTTLHTAVYRFDPAEEKWVRFGVEGSGYVIARNVAPLYQFLILNKQGLDNFALDLTSVNKIKLQPPYIMIRYSTAGAPVILGFWFHEDTERERIMSAMLKLSSVKSTSEKPSKASPSIDASGSGSGTAAVKTKKKKEKLNLTSTDETPYAVNVSTKTANAGEEILKLLNQKLGIKDPAAVSADSLASDLTSMSKGQKRPPRSRGALVPEAAGVQNASQDGSGTSSNNGSNDVFLTDKEITARVQLLNAVRPPAHQSPSPLVMIDRSTSDLRKVPDMKLLPSAVVINNKTKNKSAKADSHAKLETTSSKTPSTAAGGGMGSTGPIENVAADPTSSSAASVQTAVVSPVSIPMPVPLPAQYRSQPSNNGAVGNGSSLSGKSSLASIPFPTPLPPQYRSIPANSPAVDIQATTPVPLPVPLPAPLSFMTAKAAPERSAGNINTSSAVIDSFPLPSTATASSSVPVSAAAVIPALISPSDLFQSLKKK